MITKYDTLNNYNFLGVQFMSALEKKVILKHWIAFLDALADGQGKEDASDRYGNEVPRAYRKFSKALYEHLHLNCGFIAHFNRYGFYCEYFHGWEDCKRFLSHFEGRGHFYTADYTDINEAMAIECEARRAGIARAFAKDTSEKFGLMRELVNRAENDGELQATLVNRFN